MSDGIGGMPEQAEDQRRPVTRGAVAVGVGLAATAAGAWIAQHAAVPSWELRAFSAVNGLPRWLDVPVIAVMQLGSAGAVVATSVAARLAGRRQLALDLAVAGAGAYLAARLVKLLVVRGRPATLVLDVVVRGGEQSGLGYPSGHAAVAMALAAAAAAHLTPGWRRVAWTLAAVVGFGRVLTGAHLPVDVIGGAGLGWAVGSVVAMRRPPQSL